PIVVETLVAKPFLQGVPVLRLELDEHFSFNHVDLHAPRRHTFCRSQSSCELLRALARQASERVERDVPWHGSPRKIAMGRSKHTREGSLAIPQNWSATQRSDLLVACSSPELDGLSSLSGSRPAFNH